MPRKASKTLIQCPVVPLKDVVVFPHMVLPLLIGRTASLHSVELSLQNDQPLFVVMQRDPEVEEPGADDLHEVGTIVQVVQSLRLPDGAVKVVIEGMSRARMSAFDRDGNTMIATIEKLPVQRPPRAKAKVKAREALKNVIVKQFEEYAQQGQRIAPEIVMAFQGIEDTATVMDMVCAHLMVKPGDRQELLEQEKLDERMERISMCLSRELELLSLEQDVRDKVRDQMERGQREYYLNEQLRIIQKELGSGDYAGDDALELRKALEEAKLPKDTLEKAMRELKRFERMQPMTPESTIVQTYLEWLSELPWHTRSRDSLDLKKAQRILDEDHYGLNKVKERILECLAVRKLSKSTRGPILCLVGPPGVGKTSLGRSIARAMGRKFTRVSLGGVRDEAEIRGHRRTYIGAMPGRILQCMKKVGVRNPVFMLDEMDKMSNDFRGDPSSALLEVLDPEQNKHFSDHYLEVDYDLHEVFFVATANSEYDIPEPLLDRMEIIRLSGYTPLEKEQIALKYLIKRQLKESGLSEKNIHFSSEGLQTIMHRYTLEAGVRDLDRQIAMLCRKVARKVVTSKAKKPKRIIINTEMVLELLGPQRFSDIETVRKPEIGVSMGLAWTSFGGDTLMIESTLMKGKGDLKLTGQLGEVMQESAQAAYTYLRAHAKELKIPSEFWKNYDIHVHLPEGAIPKDGPSAGGALTVSMLSALRKKALVPSLAMTGEITLRGRVLAIGGLKEKILAAHRAKIKKVLIPKENEKDLSDIPNEVLSEINIVSVETLKDVIQHSFSVPRKKPSKAKKMVKKKAKSIATARKRS